MNNIADQLKYVLFPKSVAIVGASSNLSKTTGRVLKHLIKHGYKGKIYPINPNYDKIAELKCYHSVLELPKSVDTAFIQIAARGVPDVLSQCVSKGIKSAIIYSANMGEAGEKGKKRQEEIKILTKKAGMRILGPNCTGFANIIENITLSPNQGYGLEKLFKGRIGLISQSGGLTGAFLVRAATRGIGFSYIISTGNEMDLEVCDYMEFMIQDIKTDVIAIFLEGFRNIDRFYKVADKAQKRNKPIVVLKVGRTSIGSKAAASHTGVLTGSDAVYDSIFKQKNITRVETFEDLFEVASLFSKAKPPIRNHIGVVSTTGGGGTLLVDAGAQVGLKFPRPSKKSVAEAAKFLPSFAAKSNPMDVTISGVGGGFKKGLEILANDDNFDIIVGVVGTSSQFDPETGVKPIIDVNKNSKKPIVAFCTPEAKEAAILFEENGIPSFRTPEACGRALSYLFNYGEYLEKRKKIKPTKSRSVLVKPNLGLIKNILSLSQKNVNEYDSKKILAEYGIPTIDEKLAINLKEAKKAAKKMGYPLVLKVMSPDIPHKSEAGVIKIGIDSDRSLIKGFDEILKNANKFNKHAKLDGVLIQKMAGKGIEVIIGMSQDKQFGPTIMFGLGGILVEVFKDVSFRVIPISKMDAKEMINETRGAILLNGFRRSEKMDVNSMISTIVRVAKLSEDFSDHIQELDINPLMVYPKGRGVEVVDALIIKN